MKNISEKKFKMLMVVFYFVFGMIASFAVILTPDPYKIVTLAVICCLGIIIGIFIRWMAKKIGLKKSLESDELEKKSLYKSGFIAFSLNFYLLALLMFTFAYYPDFIAQFSFAAILLFLFIVSAFSFSISAFYYSKNPDKL